MRDKLLAVVGGTSTTRRRSPVRVQQLPVVWFNRDPSGRLLVNLNMLSTSSQPRMGMIDNFWLSAGTDESDIVCPPSGRLISAKYPNGDQLKVEFASLLQLKSWIVAIRLPGCRQTSRSGSWN